MQNESQNFQHKDPELWHLAQRRASFKKHLLTYLVMSAFFWLIWYFTGSRTYNNSMPWPVWPMLGWGIGVTLHFINAYITPKSNTTQSEYEKLMRKKNQDSSI